MNEIVINVLLYCATVHCSAVKLCPRFALPIKTRRRVFSSAEEAKKQHHIGEMI